MQQPGSLTSRNSLLDEVRIARLGNIGDDDAFPAIVLPHIHPGYHVRCGGYDHVRVSWICWAVSWVNLDTVVALIQSDYGMKNDRRSLCRPAIDITKKRCEASDLDQALRKAKVLLYSDLSKERLSSTRKSHFDMPLSSTRQKILEKHHKGSQRLRLNHGTSLDVDRSSEGDMSLPSGPEDSDPQSFANSRDDHDTSTEEIASDGIDTIATDRDFSESLARLERCGRAQGLPHSGKTRVQSDNLFDTYVRLFYGWDDYQQWNGFIFSQPEKFWLASCLWNQTKGIRSPIHVDGISSQRDLFHN